MKKVVAIVGPTAVGKTALGIQLAQMLDGEIISGDSLQVYRTLDIGTAKATPQERVQVPHHLIDIKEVSESYSVAEFQREARKLIEDLHERGKLPIVVGGTGLYIQALLEDFSLGSRTESFSFREMYETFLQQKGKEALWKLLVEKDAQVAGKISVNNSRRVVRALELLEATGKSSHSFQEEGKQLYDTYMIGLTAERSELYARINARVEEMLERGLLEEAKQLFEFGETQASQGIGYKEFFGYFRGEYSLDEAAELVKLHSRRYAKRQLTWFRNRMHAEWVDLSSQPERLEGVKTEIQTWLKEKGGRS